MKQFSALFLAIFLTQSISLAAEEDMQFPADMGDVGISDHGSAPDQDDQEEVEVGAAEEMGAAAAGVEATEAEESAELAASQEIGDAEAEVVEQEAEEGAEAAASQEIGDAEAEVVEQEAEEGAEAAASQEIGAAQAAVDEKEAEESAEVAASQEIGDAEADVVEQEAEESAEGAASQEIGAAEESVNNDGNTAAAVIEDSFPIAAPSSQDTADRGAEGTASCATCSEHSSSQGYFDFGMMSFGIEGGVSFANHNYSSGLGNGSNVDFSGMEGALGLRLSWEKFFDDNWTAGVTGSLRYYFGKTSGSHGTALSYAAKNMQRYELAAKVGKWVGNFHPYVKAGAVASDISLQVVDSTFASSTKQWVWGGTVGGGVETQVSKDLVLGGSVEYDRYADVKNNLVNGTGLGGSYTAKPSFLNAMITLTCKLDKFF